MRSKFETIEYLIECREMTLDLDGCIEIFDSEQYRRELESKTPAEINKLVEAARLEQLISSRTAEADVDHYSKLPIWTLDEVVALSFGKDPETVNWNIIQPFVHHSRFAKAYQRRRDLVLRYQRVGQLTDPVSPSLFLSWAKQLGIKLPEALVDGAVNPGISLGGSKCTDDNYARLSEELEEERAKITALREEKEELKQQNAELSQQLAEAASASEKELGPRERDTRAMTETG